MHHNIKQLKPSKSARYQQGYLDINCCKKYFPQLKNDKIIYRSSYERKFMMWLENCKNVKYWGSECFYIPYYCVLDQKTHHYYPDYFIEFNDGKHVVVEIKPLNQTIQPENKNSYAYQTYIKNVCKWKAMKEFCESKGYEFKILTENTISKL